MTGDCAHLLASRVRLRDLTSKPIRSYRSQAEAAQMCHSLGLQSFTTVDMNHGTRCYGAVLRHGDGWSIAYVALPCLSPVCQLWCEYRYSADTVPTDKLINVGQNATLLIHEATMADDQEELARAKLHSTFSQAVDVGRRYVIPLKALFCGV